MGKYSIWINIDSEGKNCNVFSWNFYKPLQIYDCAEVQMLLKAENESEWNG